MCSQLATDTSQIALNRTCMKAFTKLLLQITTLFEVPCAGLQWSTVQTSVCADHWTDCGCDFSCNIFQQIQMCRTVLNFKCAFLLIDLPLENSLGLLKLFFLFLISRRLVRNWNVHLLDWDGRWAHRFMTITYFAVSSQSGRGLQTVSCKRCGVGRIFKCCEVLWKYKAASL